MPLYAVNPNQTAIQIKPTAFSKEKDLQDLFEENLDVLLGVRFIATELTTGDRQRGRIDTLGLDQDGYPTIIEYKKSNKDNVINQGLFYLDWLVDHKGDFILQAQKVLGQGVDIDWSHPRLILIAESFSEYDKYAVNRIGANIELWTYRRYGENLIHLDPLFVADSKGKGKPVSEGEISDTDEQLAYTVEDHLKGKPKTVKELFASLREQIYSLGDEQAITEKANKMYIGYKHGKNFTEVQIQSAALKIWLDIPFAELKDPYNIAKDVSKIGHHGTGQVEVKMSDLDGLNKIIPLIEQAYQQTV